MKNRLFNCLFSVFFIFCFCFSSVEATRLATKEEMISHLGMVRHLFDTNYSANEETFSKLDGAIQQAEKEIEGSSDLSIKEYQQILKKVFASVQDSHVNISFFSTEKAMLPFTVKGSKGKYYVTSLDLSKVSSKLFPIKIGDELVSFNDRPVVEVIAELVEEEGIGSHLATDVAMAEILLTQRSGSVGSTVPRRSVFLEFRSRTDGSLYAFQMMWEYEPEIFTDACFGELTPKGAGSILLMDQVALQRQLLFPKYESLQVMQPALRGAEHLNPNAMGKKTGFLPVLGKKRVWDAESNHPFDAYIFETKTKERVGYIRIPSYAAPTGDQATEKYFLEQVRAFADLIRIMEKETEALVIDQLSNPGGSLHYMYALLSLLSDRPLHTPKQSVKLTQEDIISYLMELQKIEAIKAGESIAAYYESDLMGYPLDDQLIGFLKNYCEQGISDWFQGKYITDPQPLFGIEALSKQGNGYTKPILCLINELDFSAAELMPAILKKNNKATLFGAQTAGSFGLIRYSSYPNRYGIHQIALKHSSGDDSNGVQPDISYQITQEDLQNGYRNYADAVVDSVKTLIDNSKKG